ncbi:hypothetical protein AB0H86_05940 [Streptomyces sp. NPDC050997]|uniref:hypothetical protein n=1 Tax=Streptomyces sp. NPDC050997 TaxID=3155519 RepID=UPI003443687E
MIRKFTTSVLAATAVLGAGLSAVVTTPASAAPTREDAAAADVCLWFPDGPRGASVMVTKDKAATHSGPAAVCAVGDHLAFGTYVKIECKYTNSSGNLWYYTDHSWIYSPYLTTPSGTVRSCGQPS